MKAAIFDLDGTLLNTLQDLCNSTNAALKSAGMPSRTLDEVRMFVGNGVKNLLLRAMNIEKPEDDPRFETVFEAFRTHYAQHSNDETCAYEGVMELLARLKEAGVPMAIVSNKLDAAVKSLNKIYFSEYISVAIGENEAAGVKKKPAPDTVYTAIQELGIEPEDAVYIGDSEVDIATAANAGIPCICVTWGFRDEALLREKGAKLICSTPQQVWEQLERLDEQAFQIAVE